MLSVLLTRPEPALSALAERLEAEGFRVIRAPLATYQDISFPPPAPHDAVLFTSMQGVRVFTARNQDRSKPVFAVGDTTARAAAAAGYQKVWSAAGDGDDLAALVLSKKDSLALDKILHVAGEDTAQDFSGTLKRGGITVERLVVYKAALADSLPDAALTALREGGCDAALFFSARAGARFAELLAAADLADACAEMTAIAISPRVAQSLSGLPWRSIVSAAAPQTEAVLEALRVHAKSFTGIEQATAESVIQAFGGLRPLAQRLNLPPSTVQGWKKRGIIPKSRMDDVLRAAHEDGIRIDFDGAGDRMQPDDDSKKTEKQAAAQNWQERRKAADRRQKYTSPDRRGTVRTENYTGPDRRTGLDRRAYLERQRQRIQREKMAFVNRTIITISVMFIAIVAIGVFVLAPEYKNLRSDASRASAMEMQMQAMRAQVEAMKAQKPAETIGMKINRGIEKAAEAKDSMVAAADQALTAAASAPVQAGGTTLQSMLKLLSDIRLLQKTPEGRLILKRANESLAAVLARNAGDAKGISDAVDKARKDDPHVAGLLGHVDGRDLGAAAMLVVLNEFRGNISQQRPFESDLALLQKLAGNDPALQKSLSELAPYARTGVLSQQGLSREFKGLAMDIVMAKLHGENPSVQEKALERMSKYVKMRKVSDVKGNTTDAVVARAQMLLDSGDVKGAMRELQTLEGAPAQTAAPLIDQMAGHLIADQASQGMTSALLAPFSASMAGQGLSLDSVLDLVQGQLGSFGSGGAGDAVYVSPALKSQN